MAMEWKFVIDIIRLTQTDWKILNLWILLEIADDQGDIGWKMQILLKLLDLKYVKLFY